MPKQIVNISDTVKSFQEKVNIISSDVGWRGNLTTTEDSDIVGAINEHDAELGTITPAAMGTTAGTVSTAINELDSRLDSINDTLINSAKLPTETTLAFLYLLSVSVSSVSRRPPEVFFSSLIGSTTI